jgi:O-antigen/teichoic acid export membrane protein
LADIYKTLSNLGDVVGGEMLLRLANFGVAALIGRLYGAPALGLYATIVAVASLGERLADNGLELTGIAEVSAHPRYTSEIATALYSDKTILCVLAIGLLATMGRIAGLSSSQWLIAAMLTLRTFLYSYCRLHAGFLKGLDRTRQIAKCQGVHFSLLAVGLAYVYLQHKSLVVLLLYLLAAQIAEYICSFVVLRRLGVGYAVISASLCWDLMRRSVPVGTTYTLATVMLRCDVLILSLLASSTVVGNFAAADTGLVMIYVIAWLFSGVLLSELGRHARNSRALNLHFRKILRTVTLISIPLAAAGVLFARFAVILIFGKSFAAAGSTAAIVILALPLIFLNAAFLSRLIAKNASRVAAFIYLPAAILSLLLNYFLGRYYGAAGVAVSIVLREAVIFFVFLSVWHFPFRSAESAVTANPQSEMAPLLNT